MELQLEVVLSSCIKRKKPWPRFCWLGLEKESVFLLDDRRISEINMISGRTRKKTPKLHPLLPRVVTMAASQSGMWLAGLLESGEMFLWSRDKDSLKTVSAVPEVSQMVSAAQGSRIRLSLLVSGDGMRVLLVSPAGQVFLWECVDVRDLAGVRDGPARGVWAHIHSPGDWRAPSPQDKETSRHSVFVRTDALGDVCLSAFVFSDGDKLSVTFLKIQWEEGQGGRVGSVGYSVRWVTKTYPLTSLSPPCRPVKSRGALVSAFSPDGQLLSIVLNQRDPRATQVLFVSTQNFVSVSRGLGGCGSKKLAIPSKYVRSYWVGSVSWSAGGLLLACVLKRGSLLMVGRLGGLLSLSTSGCNVDFSPAHFLPLHPLVTYKPPVSVGTKDASLSSSSMSARDLLRQRFSVTWHPRLLYLIVSDGYMATVLRTAEKPSSASLLRAALQDTSRSLERASTALEHTQPHARSWLESVSCLKQSSSLEEVRPRTLSVSPAPATAPAPDTSTSTLPLFLQDQGTLGDTREMLQRVQAMFEDDSDNEGLPAGSHGQDGGRLEFASMFDTLHALSDTLVDPHPDPDSDSADSDRKAPPVISELRRAQDSLLTAWALGLSLGGALEGRERLLRYAVRCAVRFAALLRLTTHPGTYARKKKKKKKREKETRSFSSLLLRLLRTLVSFLPWDGLGAGGRSCLGLVVELSQQLVSLLLSLPPGPCLIGRADGGPTSQSLSTAILMLQLVSRSLDHTYSLQQETPWGSSHLQGVPGQPPWPTDAYRVPLLQEEELGMPKHIQEALPIPQRPSSRLVEVWQSVYKLTLQYWEELRGEGQGEELDRVSVLLSRLQASLQGLGEELGAGPALSTHTGERHFLFGSYRESVDAWRAELEAVRERGGGRAAFVETRLCLALLYGLLFRYRLREAQALGDHMAAVLQAQTEAPRQGRTHREAACAVVQSLGRFMASYFTNQPLLILPPHSVDVLPPLHLPHGPGVGRLVPLCQERVAGAVRGQQLSEVWTVGYGQDLLLQGGLLPEVVWLAHRLGDWKAAVSVGLAYTTYCKEHSDFTRLRWRELHLPAALEPESIFQDQLEALLGRKAGAEESHGDQDTHSSFTDSLEGEDMEQLQASVQEILKASVMAGVDVLSRPLVALLEAARDLASCLPALVPSGLYLPAPPLYCPQPTANTQDPSGTQGERAEECSRHGVSGALQRALLLLRGARCTRPAAQWYVSHLRRSRHLLHKVRLKYSQHHPGRPRPPQPEAQAESLPEGLLKLVTQGGFFKQGPGGDRVLDPVTIQTIICFRELCGLCWMLHVRDQLSLTCRKYQAARNCGKDPKVPQAPADSGVTASCVEADSGVTASCVEADSGVTASCLEALRWARRFLPFSRFLNAEEILQDTLLSLVSELPPSALVADTLAGAFPDEEESVRVPLREKYSCLLQRLRHCTVPASQLSGEEEEEEEGGEMMTILIRDKLRQRRKHQRRLARHLAPPELHLWEREEAEEERGRSAVLLERFSLGASLSTSTLTDCGRPLVYSDGDTGENTSEALSPDLQRAARSKKVKVQAKAVVAKRGVRKAEIIQEETQSGAVPGQDPAAHAQSRAPSLGLPVVGTWEFELEDEEYLRFLELFLFYVLERDGPGGGASDRDPPLLRGFCSELRKTELHSLTFDVLTTLHRHRRQRDGRRAPGRAEGAAGPVFRAGNCYAAPPDSAQPPPSSLRVDPSVSRSSLSALPLPGLKPGKQLGLFGLRQEGSPAPEPATQGGRSGSEPCPSPSSLPWEQPSESWASGSLVPMEAVELQQEMDPKLEAQFPRLGRLLEWMVRWADKRVLLRPPDRKRERGVVGGGGVVIRVKASAPAVLTALSMLQLRYAVALLAADHHYAPAQGQERLWTVAPVLEPEVGVTVERERESSVDTGYPASAGTPLTLPDQEPRHEDLSYGSQTEGEEPAPYRDTSPRYDQEAMTFELEERGATLRQPSPDDLTSERENGSPGEDDVRASPSVSPPSAQPNSPPSSLLSTQDRVMTLADLQSARREEASSSFQDEEVDNQSSLDNLGIAPSDTDGETSAKSGHSEAPGPGSPPQPDLHPLPMTGSPAGAHTASSAPGAPGLQGTSTSSPLPAPSQTPLTQADPVRQLLQDELFKLVQLQQVNFMSLMQVVGASFNSLPHLQQISLQAQPSLHPPQPSLQAQPSLHPPQANIPQPQTSVPLTVSYQTSTPNPQDHPGPQGSRQPRPAPSSPTHRGETPSDRPPVRSHLQPSMEPPVPISHLLSVHPGPAGGFQGEGAGWIPSSQGLLTTVDPLPRPASSASFLPPHGGRKHDNPAPASVVSGLKLLQLHPSLLSLPPPPPGAPVREAWGPHPGGRGQAGPSHLNLSLYDPVTLRRSQEEERRGWRGGGEERDATAPPKHLNLDQYSHQTPLHPPPRGTQPPEHHTQASRGAEPAHRLPTLPPHRPHSIHGLPLLHFPNPGTHTSISLPHLPLPLCSTSLAPPPPSGPPTRLQLLHRDPDPPSMMAPPAGRQASVARLIPLEELMSWALGREAPGGSRMQLLRVDPQTRGPAPARTPSSTSSKRQVRREQRRREGQGSKVSFRPGNSIIPPPQPTEEEPAESAGGEGLVFPLGTFASELSGQGLVARALSTTAELHAFASTHKRPPDSQDACTNTETGSPPSLADKAVSPGSPAVVPETVGSAAVLPPELFLNLRFPREPADQAAVTPSQFINVIDLEDSALLQELPSRPQPSPPTSAELHLLAASVTNSARPQMPTASTSSQDKVPQGSPDVSMSSPPGTPSEPGGDPEMVTLPQGRRGRGGALEAWKPSGIQVSAHLSEMDAQLSALQDIAEHMEREFSNTRLLVKTIETLAPGMAPDEERTHMNKTVTLAVSPEAWRPRPSLPLVTRPSGYHEEEEEEEEEGRDTEIVSSAPGGPNLHLSLSSPSAAVRNTSSHHIPTDSTFNMAGSSTRWPDLSGLSDVADILGELVRDGAMSPSALGLSYSQAAHLGRRAGQQGARAEEERRELRMWMRRKQRERTVEYHRQREEKRERERKPFKPSVASKPTSKVLDINRKNKEEKDKILLMEHHNQRAQEACSLITDLLTTPLSLPVASARPLASPQPLPSQVTSSTRRGPRGRSLSVALEKRRSASALLGRTRSLSSTRPAPHVQGSSGGQGTLSSRLGLHRPASVLPRDRLSQVTRRGMLSEQRSRTGIHSTPHGETLTTGHERWRELSQSPPGRRGGGGARERREQAEEREVVSPWDPPPEIRRLLGLEGSDPGQSVAGVSEDRVAGARGGAAGLETLSDSTGSILSKLDWAAIERIVAGEG
ncbi:ciliogenesis and planar polarity effector 1 [Osmerus eperlanus]|uniref:ciliogenesis and planar polarity effector 1 n=1 Tax=Osmerus eperlanus TaxID=29151 RepID=UPI002E113481